MNIFEQLTLELEYKKMEQMYQNVIFHFQMKCKFFEVLYKFTHRFSGREPRDQAPEDEIFKKSSILYRHEKF